MAIVCSNCGIQLPDNAKFCFNCASPIIQLSEKEQEKRFFEALEKSDTITVKELLSQNKNLATMRESMSINQTPLHIAVEKGNVSLVQLLLDYGANCNAET